MPVGVRRHQFAGPLGPGAFRDGPEQFIHAADPGEVHPVAAPGAVEVVVGEPGNDRPARHVHDFGVRSGELLNVGLRTDGQDPVVPDGEGLGHAEIRVHGEDGAAHHDEVGRVHGARGTGSRQARQEGKERSETDGALNGSVVNHEWGPGWCLVRLRRTMPAGGRRSEPCAPRGILAVRRFAPLRGTRAGLKAGVPSRKRTGSQPASRGECLIPGYGSASRASVGARSGDGKESITRFVSPEP